MELRSQTAACLTLLFALAGPLPAQSEWSYDVRHTVWRKDRPGVLRVDERGISFGTIAWSYLDIQQLTLEPKTLRLLSYKDNPWKLGADRGFEFTLASGDFVPMTDFLRARLGPRLVSGAPLEAAATLWSLPVKRLGRIRGEEGDLLVAADRIVYRTERPGQSRTWLLQDIDNISSADPYELTLTSFERDRMHYGSRKAFHFQLKQPLAEDRYNDLWRRLNSKEIKP